MATCFKNRDDEGTWFKFFTSSVDATTGEIIYDDPLEDAAEFRIRSSKKFYEGKLDTRKWESSMVLNPKTRRMEKVTSLKELSTNEIKKELEDLYDFAITGIRNAFWDEEGKEPIECTKEDKAKLKDIGVFDRFLNRAWQIIEEQEVGAVGKIEKNS